MNEIYTLDIKVPTSLYLQFEDSKGRCVKMVKLYRTPTEVSNVAMASEDPKEVYAKWLFGKLAGPESDSDDKDEYVWHLGQIEKAYKEYGDDYKAVWFIE